MTENLFWCLYTALTIGGFYLAFIFPLRKKSKLGRLHHRHPFLLQLGCHHHVGTAAFCGVDEMISELVLQRAAKTFYTLLLGGLAVLVVVQLSHCAPEATPAFNGQPSFKAGSCSLTNLKCV